MMPRNINGQSSSFFKDFPSSSWISWSGLHPTDMENQLYSKSSLITFESQCLPQASGRGGLIHLQQLAFPPLPRPRGPIYCYPLSPFLVHHFFPKLYSPIHHSPSPSSQFLFCILPHLWVTYNSNQL